MRKKNYTQLNPTQSIFDWLDWVGLETKFRLFGLPTQITQNMGWVENVLQPNPISPLMIAFDLRNVI